MENAGGFLRKAVGSKVRKESETEPEEPEEVQKESWLGEVGKAKNSPLKGG